VRADRAMHDREAIVDTTKPNAASANASLSDVSDIAKTESDTTKSFTDVTVNLPPDAPVAPVIMKAGDVLFFNGQIVHGSGPNQSDTRFRRALIAHYIAGDAQEVYRWYKPSYRMDGSEIDLGTSEIGGTCGAWVDVDGRAQIETAPETYAAKIFGPH
jgi:phytanoyl-CoA hydroxylase